jgi:centrin-1
MSSDPTRPGPSEEPTREIRDAFNLFDCDGDGFINHYDLKTTLNSLGFQFTEPEIERLIAEVDPKKTGVIDFENFSELIHAKMAEREQVDDLRSVFDMIDEDQTGFVSFTNLKRVAAELGETLGDQELRDMLMEADSDNDGELSFDDFVALIRTASFS